MTELILARIAVARARVAALESHIQEANMYRFLALTDTSAARRRVFNRAADRHMSDAKKEATDG